MNKEKVYKLPKKIILSLVIGLLLVFIATTLWGNLTIGITYYEINKKTLPSEFDSYKIAQISDLHNFEFGKDNSKIIKILYEENPNIIVITGDLIDCNRTNLDIAIKLVEEMVKIAPCYFVTGNHEAWIGDLYKTLENQLKSLGVTVLHDEMITINQGNESIFLIGLDDPDFTDWQTKLPSSRLYTRLRKMDLRDGFKLLLSHRPEAFDAYVEHRIDLVLSGHAHGGQFRLPFIGGLVAPSQGLFPKYDSGEYNKDKTTMIVSRGIGNSIIPIRINNRPEVVIVQLYYR